MEPIQKYVPIIRKLIKMKHRKKPTLVIYKHDKHPTKYQNN